MGSSINIKQEKRKSKTEVVMDQLEEALAEAENNLSKSQSIQQELGIDRKSINQFINMEEFSEKDREQAAQALQEWRDELERDADSVASDVGKGIKGKGPSKPARAARQRMRI